MYKSLTWVNDITITDLYNISKEFGVENLRLTIMGATCFGLFKGEDCITLDEEDLSDFEAIE